MADNFDFFLTNTKAEDLIDKYYAISGNMSLAMRAEIGIFMNEVKNKKYEDVLSKIISAHSQGIQFSPFACYCVAKGQSLSALRKNFIKNSNNQSNPIIIKMLVDGFLADRKTDDYLQAIYDSRASKKQGSSGQNKLISIAKHFGISEIKSIDMAGNINMHVFRITKSSFPQIKKMLKINFSFGHVGKVSDLFMKINKDYFIIEAKHVNEEGGAQSGQINELIDLIKLREANKFVHYVSFLDGQYANLLKYTGSLARSNKLINQFKEIKAILNANKNNYFVNTDGFVKIIEHYIKW